MSHRITRCFVISLFAGLFVVSTGISAETKDGKIYTQVPEVAPAAGQPAQVQPADAAPMASLFTTGPAPSWIWGADKAKNYVVKTTFQGTGESAWLRATCDNSMTIYVNGKKVASGDNFNQPEQLNIKAHLKDGENVIEAEVVNAGGPAGFVAKLVIAGGENKVRYVVTDDTWKVADKRDASNWIAAKVVFKLDDHPGGKAMVSEIQAEVPRDLFNLLPGFQAERLFTVPKDELGSWVCLTNDHKGRLIISDQGDKGLVRVTAPAVGSQDSTTVERLDIRFDGKLMSGVQGMLSAFDSLYLVVNSGACPMGLYRCKDTNGDDQYDECVKLHDIPGKGEHGPHALRLAPDGKSIYLAAGNHTKLPFEVTLNASVQTMGGVRPEQLRATLPEGVTSRLVPNWDEDMLLPRQWDAGGHAVGILAPGGWIVKTDPDGKTWDIVSVGYRNQYDFAFNADGELFSYDSDMEWDMGSPWYRPTRVVHATSGSEFGWRSGTGNWPSYYFDSLPPLVDVGPGSPVGVEFGYGAKFPAKYQKALYICDWTFGTMYAVHLEPNGSSYRATKEEFVSRTPLPLTDVVISPDGAMYFTVGGRGTQSELYRVTYIGKESTVRDEAHDARNGQFRELRHEIERFHTPKAIGLAKADATSRNSSIVLHNGNISSVFKKGRQNLENADAASADTNNGIVSKAYFTGRPPSAKSVEFLLPHLSHTDLHIRYAARVALEHFPLELWQDRVFSSTNPDAVMTGCIGLARQGEPPLLPKVLTALGKLDVSKLTEGQQLGLLRAYQLAFIRLGQPDDSTRQQLGEKFDALFPASSNAVNRELSTLMVFVGSPGATKKLIPLLTRDRVIEKQDLGDVLARNKHFGGSIETMNANAPDLQQYHYAYVLRNLKQGWTMDERKTYFSWFEKAHSWSGGVSYQKFLTNIDNSAFELMPEPDRIVLEAAGARKPYKAPELPKPVGPGKDYTLDELIALSTTRLKGRNFNDGEKMYKAARCVVCHRFAGEGGSTGHDLTQAAGRFNFKDLAESIVDPSKVISDQYKTTVIVTRSGKAYTGRIVNVIVDSITLLIDPEDSTKLVTIKKDDIEEQSLSPVSLMPKDLLKQLNENEVLDLLAYLLSRGNPSDPMFRK